MAGWDRRPGEENCPVKQGHRKIEFLLEKYTDLYDLAPISCFTIDDSSLILEATLTGAALPGLGLSRLFNRRLLLFLAPTSLL